MARYGARFWLFTAGLGFALMLIAYWGGMAVGTPSPWTDAALIVQEDLTSDTPQLAGSWRVSLRFLEPRQESSLVREIGRQLPGVQRSIERSWTPKLIQVSEWATIVTPEMLASGRLPQPGADEVLAGPDVDADERLTIGDHVLTVVGRLRPLRLPFAQGYLMPESPANERLFSPDEKDVHTALVFSRQARTKWTEAERQGFKTLTEQGKWTLLYSQDRAKLGWFLLYLSGLLLLFTGGSLLLMRSYGVWAWRGVRGWLGEALQQTVRHRRLLIGIHAAYFGLCLVAMVVIYALPEVQEVLQILVHREITGGSGLLSTAGSAYQSGNIVLAAVTTLGINFVIGSLLCITLPSVLVPGSGSLLAFYRAVLWGVLLAPVSTVFAGVMLPHSLCLFLEGEGYILATFFGLLVPLALLRSRGRQSLWARWWDALVINLKGNLLVVIVLAVAALYEAIEVIAQTWF